jgi:hypothetical protein
MTPISPVLALLALALPAAAPAAESCDRDPTLKVVNAHCTFGNQNFRYQPACQGLVRTIAMADNVIVGVKASLRELEGRVGSVEVTDSTQASSFGGIRGIATAAVQTSNLNLSAIQLVLRRLLAEEKDGQVALKGAKYENEADRGALAALQELKSPNKNIQEMNDANTADLTEKLKNRSAAEIKIGELLPIAADREKKLRELRAEVVAFKKQAVNIFASLPHPADKDYAAYEHSNTKRLDTDDMTIWDQLKADCMDKGGLRSGCSRALDGVDAMSTVNVTRGFWAAVRFGAQKVGKEAAKAFFKDDTLKNLIHCGKGTSFPVNDIPRDTDMGTPPGGEADLLPI